MVQDVQDEANEKLLRIMVKVPELSTRIIIAALEAVYRKLEKKEPVGKTKLDRLMRSEAKIETTKITARDAAMLDKEMLVFDRLARRLGVGYSIHKIPDQPGYIVFFRARQMEQVSELLSEFMKYKFYRDARVPGAEKQTEREAHRADRSRESIQDRLERARAQAAQAPARPVPVQRRIMER